MKSRLEWERGHDPKSLERKLRALNDDLQSELVGAFETIMLMIEATAKQYAPVDTGRLRADISTEVEQIANEVIGNIGNNVGYAPYQEHIYHPYLQPAIDAHVDDARRILEQAVSSAIAKHSN